MEGRPGELEGGVREAEAGAVQGFVKEANPEAGPGVKSALFSYI
jgi:hypothetical protein